MSDGSTHDEAILLVGWDSAPYDFISSLLEEGELENLERVVGSGYFGPLDTVPYVMSSCAWSTFLTGKNAGKHGIFDFYANDFVEGTYFRRPIDASVRSGLTFGEMLNEHGLSIGQVNVPMTYPVPKLDEFAVAGMLSPGVNADGFVTPQDFLDDYEALDEYKIDVEADKDADRDVFREVAREVIDSRMHLAHYALEECDDLDVFFIVFTAPDRLSHYFYHFVEDNHPFRVNESDAELAENEAVLRDFYADLDEKLGTLRSLLENEYGDVAVGVFSDHGMRPLEKVLHVNKVLAREGYLEFDHGEADLTDEVEEKIDDRVEYIFGNVDWEETAAYALGKRGAIYVNLGGREPEGIVPPDEYESVVSDLKEDLGDLVDPKTGEEIVKEINTRDELFEGEHVDRAPDLLLTLSDGYYPFGYAFEPKNDDIITTNDRPDMPFVTGIEDGPGIVALDGEKIDPDAEQTAFGLEDMLPTILQYLDLPVPDDLDGRVVTEVLRDQFGDEVTYEDGSKGSTSATGDEPLSDDDRDAVKDRLEDLGYL
jgi:predicted AlkP superfamily phosphohydrolase/phosphomutase